MSVGAPREFLGVWEAWIGGGISASRQQLGAEWQAAFLRAPIWRFWLGQEICGFPVVGAFMPSVDGVGRYFPLTVFFRGEDGEEIAPPGLDPHEACLRTVEDLLLSALAQDAAFDAITAALPGLRPPDPAPAPADGLIRLRGGALAGGAAPDAFAELGRADASRIHGGMSCWWTLGGEGFPPRSLVQRRLPDAYLFADMLTGRFDERRG